MSGSDLAARRSGALRALLVAALLLASAAAGYLAHRLAAPRATLTLAPAPTRGSAATGDASSSDRDQPSTHKIPETLPNIALADTDGRVHTLTQWRGKPLLINFWATWCEPCRREIPLLMALRRERAVDRLEVIGIAIDSPDAVHKYAAGVRIDYPLLIGEQGGLAAAGAFGMDTVLPFSVFADGRGRIVTVKVGELHRDEAELILDDVRQVDFGTLTLSQARARISEGMERRGVAGRSEAPGSPP